MHEKAADMTAGIWLLFYDIAGLIVITMSIGFIAIIFPKSARPGYRWAAHFEVAPPSGSGDLYRYIGMFGGDLTRVFLDPSPTS